MPYDGIYIYMVPPKTYLFNPTYRYKLYIIQLYQVSGMFVESQVSRFKSDKWRLLSFSSLTISSSWIQDPRSKISSRSWPRNLGSRGACWIQDPGSKISRGSWPRNLGSVDPRFPKKSLWASWILDLGSWLAGSKISQEEFLSWLARSKISQEESLGILDLGS